MRRHLKSRIGLAAAALIALAAAAAACSSESAPAAAPAPAAQALAPIAQAPATSVPAPQPTATPEAPAPVVAASSPSAKVTSDVENFVLEELVVAVGTEVTWTNRDTSSHTITSGSQGSSTGIWDSPTLTKGAGYSFTFNELGTFEYFCRIHPRSMNSTITVVPIEELALAQASAAPSPTAEPPTATPMPPTSTAVPPTPTATSVPPTATVVPPTATSVPPTATTVPPTATSVPPTATTVPPTATAEPTATATAVAVVEQKVASDVKNFVLEELVVAVGTELTWTNQDAASHTTTSGSQGSSAGILWDSPVLSKGASYSFTFNEVGTFKYFCRIHPTSMNSTITVVPVEGTESSGGGEPSPTPEAGPGY